MVMTSQATQGIVKWYDYVSRRLIDRKKRKGDTGTLEFASLCAIEGSRSENRAFKRLQGRFGDGFSFRLS